MYPGSPTARKHLSAGWFFLGGGLLVLAGVVFLLALFLTLRPLLQQDAVVRADGSTTQVSVPAGEERALFTQNGDSANCAIQDGSGATLTMHPVNGEFTSSGWEARLRFDTGDGALQVQCESVGADTFVRIGPIPTIQHLAVGIITAVGVPLVLGLSGLVVLIVTAVKRSRRPS